MVKQLVMGNEAFAHAALAAGVRVVAGYPGTPSSEVIETIASEHAAGRASGVYVEWSTNEKVALELLAGASLSGARCLFTCKQVGLNVASDALLSLNYVGIKGGLVLFVADDPGPISSQTEQDTRRFANFAKVPVLDPSTVEQGFDMMQAAFELSEAYQTPVIVRSSTRICHASAFMEIPGHTEARASTGFERSSRWVIFPRRAFEAHGEINERLKAIADDYANKPYQQFNPIEEFCDSSSQKGILAGGVSASYVLEALQILKDRCREQNKTMPAYRFMQVGTPFPFPEKRVEEFTSGLDEIIVFEELDQVLEDALLQLCGKTHATYQVFGKLTSHTLDRGENTVDDAIERLAAFLRIDECTVPAEFAAATSRQGAENASDSDATTESDPVTTASDSETTTTSKPGSAIASSEIEAPILPVRPPVLCAGCPHRGSFYAVKRALKKMRQEALFCGDIGCYTLGNALPLDAVDTCLCMGAGISMAQGFSIVEPGKKQLAFVGDSTFFASGLPGIVNAIYNGHDITVVVLDNSITAMTGAQPHPGTGDTLMGARNPGISIEAILRATGFNHIEHANPFILEESIDAARRAIEVEGPSAIIYKAPCITLVKPEEPVAITDLCTGCMKCIKDIGCPAIGFNASANKAFINENLCTGCGLCISLCAFDAIEASNRAGESHA